MDEKKKDIIPSGDDFLMEEPPLEQESTPNTPDLSLEIPQDDFVLCQESHDTPTEQEIAAAESGESIQEVLDFAGEVSYDPDPVLPTEYMDFSDSNEAEVSAPDPVVYHRWSPAMDADATEAAQEKPAPHQMLHQRPMRKGRPKR